MIRFDCRYYKASRPCIFNKQYGAECPSCTRYSPYQDRILFIKLDAIGDVLRSASMLPVIAKQYKQPYIAWLTRPESAELVQMMPLVDEVIVLSDETAARIMTGGWTQVISLSNDIPSASLAALAGCKRPTIGFSVEHGIIMASNDAAQTWLEMAAFDRLKRANTRSYQEHMLAILGSKDDLHRPDLTVPVAAIERANARCEAAFGVNQKPRIAINVGAGARWPKKMLTAMQIVQVIRMIATEVGTDIMLVGGAAECDKTSEVVAEVGSLAQPLLTPDSIADFVAILLHADVMLCGDTLAMHIATAINLPTVAVFGPTSAAEIADFGLITKVSTSLDCLGCYGDCAKTDNCMSLIDIPKLAARIIDRLPTTCDLGEA